MRESWNACFTGLVRDRLSKVCTRTREGRHAHSPMEENHNYAIAYHKDSIERRSGHSVRGSVSTTVHINKTRQCKQIVSTSREILARAQNAYATHNYCSARQQLNRAQQPLPSNE